MQTVFIIFAAAAAIQVIYFTIFFVALVMRQKKPTAGSPPISVIVCAHDEENNLRELIPLLLQQHYPDFEIIIVDDRSNDDTYDLLLAETQKHNGLRMVHIKNKPDHINGKKYAITLGIKAAKNDWVLLTDADCRPHNQYWIQAMAEHCTTDKEIVLGYSPYKKTGGLLNLFVRFETLFTAVQYISLALLGNPYMGVGRNLAYRKSLFLNNKGFDGFANRTGGDDDLFVNRHARGKNTTVSVGENAVMYSLPKNSWRSFLNQKIRHLAAGKHYRFSHKLVLGLFSITHLFSWLVAIPLLANPTWFPWVSSALIVRTFLLSVTIHGAARRFGHKFEYWAVPLLDFLFVIYYLSTAPVALLTKKLQWRS